MRVRSPKHRAFASRETVDGERTVWKWVRSCNAARSDYVRAEAFGWRRHGSPHIARQRRHRQACRL